MMIERYLDRSMTPAEEIRFLDALSHDEGLQAMLRAEELIRGSMRSERIAIATDHSHARAKAMGMLAAIAPGVSAPPLAEAFSTGGGSLSAAGSSLLTPLLGALAVVAAVVGGFFLFNNDGQEKGNVATPPAVTVPKVEREPGHVVQPVPLTPGIRQEESRAGAYEAGRGSERPRASGSSATSRKQKGVTENPAQSDAMAEPKETPMRQPELKEAPSKSPMEFKSDRVRAKVRIDVEKKQQ